MAKEFEVGKFYLMQIHPNYGNTPVKRVTCLCVKIRKRRIWFEHLYKDTSGALRKVVEDRRLDHFEHRPDEAVSRDQFFSMACTPDDVGYKPDVWDSVPSAFKAK